MKVAHRLQHAIFLTIISGLSARAIAEEIPTSIPASVTEIQKSISAFGAPEVPCPKSDRESKEPLVCSEPVKAVCGTSSTYLIERENKLKELQKHVLEKSMEALTKMLGKDPRKFTYQDYLSPKYANLPLLKFKEIEHQTFEALKDLGWSKEKVAQLIQKIKTAELDRVHPGDGVDPGKKKLLENALWITAENLEQFPEENRSAILTSWNFYCGREGMELQAYTFRVATAERIKKKQLTDADPSLFTVCPGLLLEAATDLDGPERLTWVIGHELGHIIQPDHPIAGTLKVYLDADRRKIAEAEKSYQKTVLEAEAVCPKLKGCFVRKAVFSDESFMNSCDIEWVAEECDRDTEMVRKKVAAVSSAGRARQQIIDQITSPVGDTNRDRAMLSCLKTYDLAEMNDGEKQIKALHKKLDIEFKQGLLIDKEDSKILGTARIKISLAEFESEFGRQPDAVDLHQDELIADYWGIIALASRLKQIPTQELRTRVAIENLRAQCHSEAKTKDIDFEQHPPDAYRIVRTFSNPEIRAALGCKTMPVKPWCER